MSKTVFTTILSVILVAFGLTSALRADVIETKDGSRIVGKLTKISTGKLYLSTVAAGDIVIAQSEVVSITTNHPVSLRLDSSARLDGTLSTTNGTVRITAPQGIVTTPIQKISQSWPVDGLDPLYAHWVYEATVDINGTSGNKSQLGTAFGFSAKRIAPSDQLDYYTAYNRQVTEGAVSADQFKAGVDYTSDLDWKGGSWFARDEAGFDKVMDINFYETAAVGLGQDLIKNHYDTLTGRIGLAYRLDDYSVASTPNVDSAALDFELAHDLRVGTWELVDKIVVLPEIDDFSNTMVTQDSYFEIPLKNPAWKLRLGLANSYESEPPPGIKKLDSTYYTRLILDWGQ